VRYLSRQQKAATAHQLICSAGSANEKPGAKVNNLYCRIASHLLVFGGGYD
jgi:hypothetical protein